jgi:hypothetical protein
MDLWVLHQAGEMLLHRNMQARPEMLLKALAPYRDDIVGAVECMVTWYWLADLCAREGRPFVLGHALSRQAIQGGKATNDKMDAQNMAGLLLRNHAKGQQYLARLENKHGKGQALTGLAPKLARAVYSMLQRATGFHIALFLNGYESRAGEPDASLATRG